MSESVNDSERIAALLRAHEESLLRPEFRHNRAAVAALLAEDFEEFGTSGRRWSRSQVLDLLESETWEAPGLTDFHCQLLAETVALVTYATIRPAAQPNRPSRSERSSIWIQVKDQWKLRFHQGTPAS
jgi:hypothetical protein